MPAVQVVDLGATAIGASCSLRSVPAKVGSTDPTAAAHPKSGTTSRHHSLPPSLPPVWYSATLCSCWCGIPFGILSFARARPRRRSLPRHFFARLATRPSADRRCFQLRCVTLFRQPADTRPFDQRARPTFDAFESAIFEQLVDRRRAQPQEPLGFFHGVKERGFRCTFGIHIDDPFAR